MLIRYMGNKSKLSKKISEKIHNHSNDKKHLVDLMAGSGSSFLECNLNLFQKVIFNDSQLYSKYICSTLYPNKKVDKESILNHIRKISTHKSKTNYYYKNFGGLYFSKKHSKLIDNYSNYIHNIEDENEKSLLLSCLLYVACQVQMTTGHFAQYLNLKSIRRIKIANQNFSNVFKKPILDLFNRPIVKSEFYNLDASKLLNFSDAIYYLDPPYTNDQYSRFYHILETIVNNKKPKLFFKGLYPEERFKSNFSSKTNVKSEFLKYFKTISKNDSVLILSYYDKGLLSISELKELANNYFSSIKIEEIKYQHSSQGKGTTKVREYLLEFYNGKNI